MNDNTNIRDDDHEETDESLSLCDFPLTHTEQGRQSSFDSTDYFEFVTEIGSDLTQISHAEDIFFSGKLVPLNQQLQSQSTSMSNSFSNQSVNRNSTTDWNKLQNFHQRRSESLSELKSNRSDSTKARLLRNSRSLDDQKLNRNSSMNGEVSPEVRRNSGKSYLKVVKPRWYILTFGLVKFPPEMDLRDIKNRQVRRSNSINLFPSFDAVNEVPANRSEKKCSSKLLRVLSCKGRSSVAVTASYHCLQQVEKVPLTCHGT